MNLIKRYIEYLKNNPERYWFKRKLFGWGWVPATIEGWLVILAFLAFLAWDFKRIDALSHSASDTLRPFSMQLVIAVIALIAMCYYKGEKPRWQWGFPKKEDVSQSENK